MEWPQSGSGGAKDSFIWGVSSIANNTGSRLLLRCRVNKIFCCGVPECKIARKLSGHCKVFTELKLEDYYPFGTKPFTPRDLIICWQTSIRGGEGQQTPPTAVEQSFQGRYRRTRHGGVGCVGGGGCLQSLPTTGGHNHCCPPAVPAWYTSVPQVHTWGFTDHETIQVPGCHPLVLLGFENERNNIPNCKVTANTLLLPNDATYATTT